MFLKCPYCDSRVKTRFKPCPYCGGASSNFETVYEDGDFLDKVGGELVDTRIINDKPVEVVRVQRPREVKRCGKNIGGTILLLVAMLGFWFMPVGIVAHLVVICTYAGIKNCRTGLSTSALIMSIVGIIANVFVIVIALFVYSSNLL